MQDDARRGNPLQCARCPFPLLSRHDQSRPDRRARFEPQPPKQAQIILAFVLGEIGAVLEHPAIGKDAVPPITRRDPLRDTGPPRRHDETAKRLEENCGINLHSE